MVPFENTMPPKNPATAPTASAAPTVQFLPPLPLPLPPPLAVLPSSMGVAAAEVTADGGLLMLILLSTAASTAAWLFAVILVLPAGAVETRREKERNEIRAENEVPSSHTLYPPHRHTQTQAGERRKRDHTRLLNSLKLAICTACSILFLRHWSSHQSRPLSMSAAKK